MLNLFHGLMMQYSSSKSAEKPATLVTYHSTVLSILTRCPENWCLKVDNQVVVLFHGSYTKGFHIVMIIQVGMD